MNYLYKLPEELIRLIYEYDDTYSVFYKKCVNELTFLRKSYPVQFTQIFFSYRFCCCNQVYFIIKNYPIIVNLFMIIVIEKEHCEVINMFYVSR